MSKNKQRRFEEMAAFSNVVQPEMDEILNSGFRLKGKWSKSFFGNSQPLHLELACGKGEYTLGLARQFAEVNFLGIDIKGARIWRGAKTAIEENLPNAGFLRSRIEMIGSFFAGAEVQEVWITFPDPQRKKPRKRLTSPLFLKRYQQFLAPGGIIHLKTDSRELYEYTREVIELNQLEVLTDTADLYHSPLAKNPLLNIKTFYEKQFLASGKKITYLKFRLKEIENFISPPKKYKQTPDKKVYH